MAIQINKPIIFNGNITLDTCYIRLDIKLLKTSIMDITCSFYQNRNSYKKNNNSSLYPNLNWRLSTQYNFSTDGDPILYSHNKYIEYLTTPEYNEILLYFIDESGQTIDTSNFTIKKSGDIYTIVDKNNVIYYTTNEPNSYIKIDNNFYEKRLMRIPHFDPSDLSIVDI